MAIEAKILADSISKYGFRLVTFEATFPRIILAELNTHRMLARNSASSRAIPIEKMLKMVLENPYVPSTWGKNQKGMQAGKEVSETSKIRSVDEWLTARDHAVVQAQKLLEIGIHKGLTNRLLEPFMWHTAIISATDWSNLFHLRNNPQAHEAFRELAAEMQSLYEGHSPVLLNDGYWHLPLISDEEKLDFSRGFIEHDLQKISIGRCARVSYLTHDGRRDLSADVGLAEKLGSDGHMSPFEHVARPMTESELTLFAQPKYVWDSGIGEWFNTGQVTHYLGNFEGWIQARKLIPGEEDILGYNKEHEEEV